MAIEAICGPECWLVLKNTTSSKRLLSRLVHALRRARSLLKMLLLLPFGVRIHHTSAVAWSVAADGGGGGGRVVVGRNTTLDIGSVLRAYGGVISIGNDCSLNPYCVLLGGAAGLVIGNGVRIAAHTSIIASNHVFEDVSTYVHLQGISSKGIVIEDDVWIGAGAKILDGVIVREGTIVAAGAVVTRTTQRYSIVAGVPATIKSMRSAPT